MNANVTGAVITFGLVGALLIVVGVLFLLFKSAIIMMSGYEQGKYEDEGLRKHMGWHLVVMGLGFVLSATLSRLMPEYAILPILLYIPALIAVTVKMIFQGERRYRIKK